MILLLRVCEGEGEGGGIKLFCMIYPSKAMKFFQMILFELIVAGLVCSGSALRKDIEMWMSWKPLDLELTILLCEKSLEGKVGKTYVNFVFINAENRLK